TSGDGKQAEVDPTRLSQIPLYANQDHNSLEAIADRFTTETYNPGYTVCEEGEVGLKLYILVRGRVEVLKRVADGDVRRLAVLEDGDFFGEIALLETVPRTATVRTLTPCVLLALDQHQFTTLLRVAPGLRAVFEHAAAERRREIDALIGGATADVLR
ncbi:MAG: ATP-binding cassette, subfamily bacterial, partial [Chloroflexota bacterium]|nr:ATP-binding cassette, subfamily bacterial [Chloroflexota bacterium]